MPPGTTPIPASPRAAASSPFRLVRASVVHARSRARHVSQPPASRARQAARRSGPPRLVRVAGACGNRTHQGPRSGPQLVLKTSQTTRPDPPPYWVFEAMPASTIPVLSPRVNRRPQQRRGTAPTSPRLPPDRARTRCRTVQDVAGLVAAQLHDDVLGDAGAHQVADSRAAKVVRNAPDQRRAHNLLDVALPPNSGPFNRVVPSAWRPPSCARAGEGAATISACVPPPPGRPRPPASARRRPSPGPLASG